MRLDILKVDGFKNLNNVSVDFDKEELSTVLVGLNGTGKSNVLEALVTIFRALDLRETIPFRCFLRYECNKHAIEIDNRWTDEASPLRILVDGIPTTINRFIDQAAHLLPSHVFGYYSGGTRRFEVLFDKHQNRYYTNIIKPGSDRTVDPLDPSLRRLFYARPFYGQLALLTHFADLGESVPAFLARDMKITGFHSALIVMKRPSWAKNKPNEIFREHGDPHFWYATGVVRHLLSALWEHALAPLRITENVLEDYREKPHAEEHIYIFIKDELTLREIARPFGSQQSFFAMLETLDISGLVREVKLWVKRDSTNEELPFHEISDGEKQLLTVLGLMKFTQQKQSLFLLDEPDTHLNPAWKRDYLNLIQDVAGKSNDSYLVMTSHDPLTISGLEAKQIQILSQQKDGTIRASRPMVDPKGLGVAGILTDVFGLDTALDLDTQNKLDLRNELFAIPEKSRTPEQAKLLQKTTEELAALGFRQASRDPLYAKFLQRMEQRKLATQRVFTPDEISQLNDIADEIIEELMREENDDLHKV
ncbi:MAG: AAA family ATPase [Rhizobium rhizophilum]|uniref:AAA family ATPase n=1 Tax=Rhizobium rhizophilum TaxID=1850373 RepID=UPI003919F47B